MTTLTTSKFLDAGFTPKELKRNRIESVDLLRGIVMIIMALDHVRNYFHYDAFLYSPTDLNKTGGFLFFTRFITHYCAPVFVFLSGISAHIYGSNRSRRELSFYLLKRGLWLVFAELSIITLGWTFNPTYPLFNLQVIWAIGISMIVLSAMIYMNRIYILLTGVLLIAAHNLLDNVHVPGNGIAAFLWSFLHEPGDYALGRFHIFVHYPVIPWVGIMAVGYYFGGLYNTANDAVKRKKMFLYSGAGAIALFIILRSFNFYGDAAQWYMQKNTVFSILSFLNVTKYPPSFLYTLITLGPAMIFLSMAEKPLNIVSEKIVVFGRVPFFYYIIHLYLIHLFAIIGAMILGYGWPDMILSDRVNRVVELKGYGFNLFIVYLVWMVLVILLYPCCKWFGRYKRNNQSTKKWLTYL
ncbi:MAG: heparan-alpha-glucosaminide N-acetyltransferase domain-containing protein [Ferruginibacter sp.]